MISITLKSNSTATMGSEHPPPSVGALGRVRLLWNLTSGLKKAKLRIS